ncbi:MAG TPA: ATP-dependent helicase HrpB [Caulobacteraceae bacterium]|nr:ATP-dependent helicase HrpB [Caulobacteraceae bacterium]
MSPGVENLAASLPIAEALAPLASALSEGTCAVLVAPPGAGKTTVVPLALMDEPWVQGRKLIVLEPRRLAARAAAARMAATLGESVGDTVGYRVRLESRVSARTRIEVVTEGVFTRMILDDPGLDGVAAVLFDEFHERSLDADLGLAFTRDAQQLLREDLRLLVMSATLDGARIAALLDDAPAVESQGRAFPVETRYLGRDQRASIDEQMARAIGRAVDAEEGGVLAFFPGQGEILRTAERLRETLGTRPVDLHPLYGALEAGDQDRAIAPAPPGRRKIVLATSIAQTSLTLEDVRLVVDSGWARVPRFDPASGVTRLATVRVSRATADQRRGRAGRTAPGVCWRLWDEAETRGLPPFDRPEILEADLSRLLLDVARWGASNLDALALLDRPPAGAIAEARRLLQALGALDDAGRLTSHGAALARLPLSPRLANLVLTGGEAGAGERAALLAAVLSEGRRRGRETEIGHLADALRRDRSPAGRALVAQAERWARLARAGQAGRGPDDGLLLGRAFPDRIGRARGGPGEYQLASGRGARLEPADPLAREPWLVAAELAGGGAHDRIALAARLDIHALRAWAPDLFAIEDRLVQSASGAHRAQRVVRLGELVVQASEIAADPALVRQALLEEVRQQGVAILPWGEEAQRLRARVAFLRRRDEAWPDLSDLGLTGRIDDWLAPLLEGRVSLAALGEAELEAALRGLVPWGLVRRLEAEAPPRWSAPTGSSHAIDYEAEGAPKVRVRVQELFGLKSHPSVAGEPLALALLSPAHREIQVTRDLPGFWAGSWADMRKDMRGRYPKHPWPEDPANAAPTTRAKPRS